MFLQAKDQTLSSIIGDPGRRPTQWWNRPDGDRHIGEGDSSRWRR